MHMSLKEDAEVITSDGKKIGNVKRKENEDYFLVYKKGLLTDEEVRVPVSAIVPEKDGSSNNKQIRLNMTEESLKHGREIVEGQPNSEFMHGLRESEPKLGPQKQVIHFDPVEPAEESKNWGISSPPVTGDHQAVLKQGDEHNRTLYSCDMCLAKFDNSEDLQKHRGEIHKAPVNI
jgi:sporulation protein YlmC with PRC-barrel domain